PMVSKHGNTLSLQRVIQGMNLRSYSPSFLSTARTTGGEKSCAVWAGFAERSSGLDASVVGQTSWRRKVRTSVGPELDPKPGNPDEECGPFGLCWSWKDKNGQYK
ncbi:hypothetical protein SCLCIDRAFT_133799, partial [Scleroderma citrinum Foug A]